MDHHGDVSASYADLFVHLVWATAGRKPWIFASVEGALFAAITAKCRALRCPPIAVGGVADHVHLLVALSPAVAVATLMREVKGGTSHLMTHDLLPGTEFRWQ